MRSTHKTPPPPQYKRLADVEGRVFRSGHIAVKKAERA